MKYNFEVKNTEALPVPYVTRVGQAFAIDSLHSNQVLHLDVIHIGVTTQRQILVHCNGVDYIFNPLAGLELTPKYERTAE